ncbi:MAG TPA: recombination protein O N-terminal domain-containing protein, partial [Saprospiraceae bacterium]|nr:recombination protein O N-terminal domain-containing protein [Saprospiraceae bacterium]
MALIVTEAILLRVIKYSDNSFICEALTADYGLISFIASRGSKHNQSIPNHLRIMNLVQITYYPSKSTQGLHRLKEVFFTHVYNKVNIDVKKSLAGTFISEVILNVVKVENLDNDKMYALLKGKLIYLDLQE